MILLLNELFQVLRKEKLIIYNQFFHSKIHPKSYYQGEEIKNIDNFLKKNHFKFNATKLYNFIVLSLKLRENSKFIFTRALSDYLQIIEKLGKKSHLMLRSCATMRLKIF